MCTGVLTFVTPMSAAIEKLSGMTDPVSLKSRLTSTAVFYLGLGKLVKLRDYSISRIEEKSGKELKGWAKWGHDSIFLAGISVIVRAPIYLLSGETDWKKIAWAIAGNTAFGAGAGGFIAYFGDMYREILNPEREEKRVPTFIKNRGYKTKKNILIGLTATSIALTGLIYNVMPDKSDNNQDYQNYQQIAQQMIKRDDNHLEERF